MLELSRDLGLADEATLVEGLLRELLVEPLERDMAQEVAIRRGMDATHAASAELREHTQVLGRRNTFRVGLVVADAVVAPRRDALDDVNWLGLVLFPRHRSRTVPWGL